MKRLYITLLLSIVLVGCNRSHLNNAECLFNASLGGKVRYLTSEENWQTFGGDGFRVEIYQILDEDYLVTKSLNGHFDTFDYRQQNDANGMNPDYLKFIENGAGFYRKVCKKTEINELVIDTINNKMIYYYCYL